MTRLIPFLLCLAMAACATSENASRRPAFPSVTYRAPIRHAGNPAIDRSAKGAWVNDTRVAGGKSSRVASFHHTSHFGAIVIDRVRLSASPGAFFRDLHESVRGDADDVTDITVAETGNFAVFEWSDDADKDDFRRTMRGGVVAVREGGNRSVLVCTGSWPASVGEMELRAVHELCMAQALLP